MPNSPEPQVSLSLFLSPSLSLSLSISLAISPKQGQKEVGRIVTLNLTPATLPLPETLKPAALTPTKTLKPASSTLSESRNLRPGEPETHGGLAE